MKRFLNVLPLALAAILAVSCYDDSKVMERLDNLESRVDSLTAQVGTVETLINALESNVYIKAVTEVTGGYEIEFTDGKKITIKNGQNGADAPEISALKDADGIYYWTLDGEWLLDAEGNKVPAGMGQPKLKTENGQWYISADGQEWALIGPDVACTIKNVEIAETAVTFTLANGETIVIPIFTALDITFDVEDGTSFNTMARINYAITGGTENNRVVVISNNVTAVVTPTDATAGVITVTPENVGQYEIVVFVTDGVSSTIFKTLKFGVDCLVVTDELATLGAEAGTLEIPVATNVEYTVTTDCDWLTLPVETRAAELRQETITLNVAANESFYARSATVTLTPNDETIAWTLTIPVAQKGHANKSWSKEVLSYEGYDATQRVKLAQYGEYILLANTTKVYMLDPATGEAVNTIQMPEGFTAHNVLVDEGGNLLIGADALDGAGNVTLYYVADPLNPAPEELISWNAGNYYCVGAGNIRVKGNVKDDAVITAVVTDGAGGACLAWEVIDGVIGEWKWTNPPYTNWELPSLCFAPLGSSMADGFLYIGYGGDYNLYYTDSFVAGGGTTWTVSYVTGSSWMENYNCIATATYGEGKYAAIVKGCHFAYDATDVVLLDVTDPTAAKELYVYNGDGDAAWDWGAGVNNSWTGGGTFSDVLLAPTADGMLMVYVDSNYGTIGCVAIR